MSIILGLVLPVIVAAVTPSADLEACNPDKITLYRMVLHTYWTRERFPKHYPDWKPPAQWSKVYGVSHNNSHVLFRLGGRVASGVRQLAELGRTDSLGGALGSLDEFGATAIPQGAGRTEAKFFVDGNHSRVSVITKMIPSPDWFIGVDSFDLCVDGNWLDSITLEVDPLDAGTDNGFTFTAPNWPTAPQGVAYRITSTYPPHPAGSFFYPHLRRLPPIATFQFIKMREYELTEKFRRDSDDHQYDLLKLDKLDRGRIDVPDGNQALEVAEEVEREETPRIISRGRASGDNSFYSYYLVDNATTTDEPRWKNEVDPRPPALAASPTSSALRSLARRYRARRRQRTDSASPAERRKRKRAKLLDCRVSSWGEWSDCTTDLAHGKCVGSSVRMRRIIRRRKAGGAPCPPTVQSRWCAVPCLTEPPLDWQHNLT